MPIEIKCPVCNNMTSGSFCEHCGFEIHILPNEISLAIMNYEQERVDKYKKVLKDKENSLQLEKKLSEDNIKKQKEIESLISQNERLQSEQVVLNETVKQTENEKPLAFLVMIQDNSVSAIFEIHEGENSFGYARPHDRHQQIICRVPVSDIHFAIKAVSSKDSKGRIRTKYFVTPRDGQIYGSADRGNLIVHERELEKNESVYIDEVKFTLVTNKNK